MSNITEGGLPGNTVHFLGNFTGTSLNYTLGNAIVDIADNKNNITFDKKQIETLIKNYDNNQQNQKLKTSKVNNNQISLNSPQPQLPSIDSKNNQKKQASKPNPNRKPSNNLKKYKSQYDISPTNTSPSNQVCTTHRFTHYCTKECKNPKKPQWVN